MFPTTCLRSEERRRFMNFVLSQTDREYLRRIQSYNQLLAQRNKLLKMADVPDDLLDTLSEQMSAHAAYIYEKRSWLIAQLSLSAEDYYGKLSGGRETSLPMGSTPRFIPPNGETNPRPRVA